ncbi:MAG: hypothetical protein ACLT8E_04300 [Akkermansia sp.]
MPPELAPGTAPVDAAVFLARRAAGFPRRIAETWKAWKSLPPTYTHWHLRRAFAAEFVSASIQYLQTLRSRWRRIS